MNPNDLYSGVTREVLNGLVEQGEGDLYGNVIDLQQVDGQANLHVAAKKSNGAPTVATILKDSPDGSTWATVTEVTFDPVSGDTQSVQNVRLDPRLVDRYVYTVTTVGGSGTPKSLLYGEVSYRKKVI